MIEAVQNHVHLNSTQQVQQFEQKVGFIEGFPVPNESTPSATLIRGWELGVPVTSRNKDLAWELITLMLDPKIMTPFHARHGLLPTQIPIGEGPYAKVLNQTIPYYGKLISVLQLRGIRPNIPEYPQIVEHIHQALNEVFYGIKQPKQALDNAAAKSAKVLGW